MTMLLARPVGAQACSPVASPRRRAARPTRPRRLAVISFRPLPDHRLYELDDDGLLGYIIDARNAKADDHAERATHMLLYKHEPRIRKRVASKLPTHLRRHADTVTDWIIERVTKSALRLKLEGETVGHWVSWWQTAVDRQFISFFRSSQGQALEAERGLPSEHEGDDDAPPDRLGVEFDDERVVRRALYGQIVDSALAKVPNATHRSIIRAAFWDDRTSKDIAAEYGETPNNVDQIKSRFRRDLRAECQVWGVTDS